MGNDIDILVTYAMNGDEAAFETLLGRVYDRIYAASFKWCGTREEAEDVTQEVCVKLARTLGSFKKECAFDTWLYRMTLNTVKDYFKQASRARKRDQEFAELQVLETGETQEQAVLAKTYLAHIYMLSEPLRDAILLVYSEDRTHAEAAEILGCKEGTISWRISEAKKQLLAMREDDDG